MVAEAVPHASTLTGAGLRDALVILGAAGIIIPAFARLRISPVIGFILIGVIIGPFGLGGMVDRWPWIDTVTIADPARIAPFAEVGIILLLFSIGLELSFSRLWAMRRLVFGLGAAETLGLGLLIAGAIILSGAASPLAALGLGLALALSSTAIVMPIAGTRSTVGRTAFAMLLFEDLAIVPIIFLLAVLAARGGDPAAMIGTVLWQGAIVTLILVVVMRTILPPLFAQAARARQPELFLSIVLLTVIVAALATSAVGLSPVAGALLAGLLLAETDYRDEVERITHPFRGLALGVFLITIGMQVDIDRLLADPAPYAIAVVGILFLKAVGTALLLRLIRVRPAVAAEIGLLMASPGEATLIVLATALQVGLIAAPDAAFWQTVTSIGMTITPLLAIAGRRVAARISHAEARLSDGAAGATAHTGSPVGPHAATLLIGFGRVGRTVADLMAAHDRPYLAIEADIDAARSARAEGYAVRWGDTARAHTLDHLPFADAPAVVLTMNDPVAQLALTRRIRARHPALPIIARARDADHAADLYRAGASDAVPETLESSLQLSEAVLVDLGVAMGPVIASVHDLRSRHRAAIRARAGLGPADASPAGEGPGARRGARRPPWRVS